MQATPLVADTVLQSLSKDLTYLHNRVSMLPSDTPIEVALPKTLFDYDDDAIAWFNKEYVKKFLSGSMLNISLIQTFMRALQEHLRDIDSSCQVGWLCPEQISTTRILGNPPTCCTMLNGVSSNQCVRGTSSYSPHVMRICIGPWW